MDFPSPQGNFFFWKHNCIYHLLISWFQQFESLLNRAALFPTMGHLPGIYLDTGDSYHSH